MHTRSAAATLDFARDAGVGVYTIAALERMGCSRNTTRARLAAGRWQRIGNAVVLHNGELRRDERWTIGVLNCGPRAVLASFSAAQSLGLNGWERDEVHVLAPAGVSSPNLPGIGLILHRARCIDDSSVLAIRRCQRMGPALVLAASGFAQPRPACAILAAGVQQRLVTADELRTAIAGSGNARHRKLLRSSIEDIAMGAEALSEIDFVRLCRKFGLPRPRLQAVRLESNGRRRYLDAEWERADGRRVAVEVDGALHLVARRWWDDQLRQNEIVLNRTIMLRYPSAMVRIEAALVAGQLRRALFDKW